MLPGQTLALFVLLTLLAACGPLNRAGKAPETSVLGPDPETAKLEDPSDIAPDESALRPADSIPTGLVGPKRTIAGLGDPGQPGLWLETPLVKFQGAGRIALASGGGSVAVTLLPVAGETTAGSRLSLDAMRQLGAPLTELVEIIVTPGA